MSQVQSPIASTTPDALRAAIAEAVQVDAQQLQSAVGSIQVATSDQLQIADHEIKSLYDADSRTLTLLADRIPAGQEAQALSGALVRSLGREAAAELVGQDAAEAAHQELKRRSLSAGVSVSLADSEKFDEAIRRGRKIEALQILHKVMGVEFVDSGLSRGQGTHDAPGVHEGAPMFDLTRNSVYPRDFYEGRAHEYGSAERMEMHAVSSILSCEAKPNSFVQIYRAVEKDGPRKIQPGDWVTTSLAYAKEHAKSNISGPTKILKGRVRACELFTEGNSLLEWGYNPQPEKLPRLHEGFTLQECVNGKLFEQNHLYPRLTQEQKLKLGESEELQGSIKTTYTMSSLWLKDSSADQLSMLVHATDFVQGLRDSGQLGAELDAVDPEGKAFEFWRVRDRDRPFCEGLGLKLFQIGDQSFFAQMQPSLAQEQCFADRFAQVSPARMNKFIRAALPETRSWPVYHPAFDASQGDEHTQWLAKEIQASIDDPRPSIPHEEVFDAGPC